MLQPATVLCVREFVARIKSLYDSNREHFRNDQNCAWHVLRHPAADHLGMLQTFAVRIVASPFQPVEDYEDAIPEAKHAMGESTLVSLTGIVADAFGREVSREFAQQLTAGGLV